MVILHLFMNQGQKWRMENGGQTSTYVQMEVETPHPAEKGIKREREKLINLESDAENEAKKAKTVEEGSSSIMPGFSLQLGDI